MGTIVSSPEAPATIDTEINPDVDIPKKDQEQLASKTPDPLIKELQSEANKLQKREGNESQSPQRQNYNLSPERSDIASPKDSKIDSNFSKGVADKMGVTGQISNTGESNNLGITGQSFASDTKKTNMSTRGARGKAGGSRKPADNKSSNSKGEKKSRSQADVEHAFRKVINTAIIAKGTVSPSKTGRIASAISVMPTTDQDVQRNKKYLLQSHPLKGQEPSQWKNIPPCVSTAISHIITSVIAGEESLFEWQMATNARLVKLQTQLNTLKQEIPEIKEKTKLQIDERAQKCEKLSKRLVSEITNQFESFKNKQEEYNEKNKTNVDNNRNKLSKQHASIVELQGNLTKSMAEMDEKLVPLLEQLPKISLDMKADLRSVEEGLTVWFMDEEGESQNKPLKQFMMDKFEELDESSKKKLAPFEKRLAAVDEQLEERHIAMNSQINQVKQKVQTLWTYSEKQEKMHLAYETRFDKLDREFDIKMAQHEEKFKQNDTMIRKNSSRLMSPSFDGRNVNKLEQELQELKKEILPYQLKQLENELETKIKENGSLVTAKCEKKLKDFKLQIKDSISKQEKELSKKIKESGKAIISQIGQNVMQSPPSEQVAQAPSPPPPETNQTEPDVEEEEEDKDNDEYVKLLIKDQLDERIKIVKENYDKRIQDINDELEKLKLEDKKLWERQPMPTSLNTTIQVADLDEPVKEQSQEHKPSVEKSISIKSPPGQSPPRGAGMTEEEQAELRQELNDHNERISQLATNIKVLQLIVDDLPKKRPEDDPHHEPYSNLKNDLTSNFNHSPRLSRSLKRNKRATSSIDGRNNLKKALQSSQSNETTNEKIVKQHESQYMKYAGIANSNNAILNTAYKGQKTVQSHVIQAGVSTSTHDNRVHVSMPSVDYSQPSFKEHNTLTLFSFPEQERDDVKIPNKKFEGITRIPQINTIDPPMTTRYRGAHQQSAGEGYMTARISQKSKHYGQVRNSMAIDAGLPSLTANLSKKNQKSKQGTVKKEAWGPGGTKFEKLQGF